MVSESRWPIGHTEWGSGRTPLKTGPLRAVVTCDLPLRPATAGPWAGVMWTLRARRHGADQLAGQAGSRGGERGPAPHRRRKQAHAPPRAAARAPGHGAACCSRGPSPASPTAVASGAAPRVGRKRREPLQGGSGAAAASGRHPMVRPGSVRAPGPFAVGGGSSGSARRRGAVPRAGFPGALPPAGDPCFIPRHHSWSGDRSVLAAVGGTAVAAQLSSVSLVRSERGVCPGPSARALCPGSPASRGPEGLVSCPPAAWGARRAFGRTGALGQRAHLGRLGRAH